MSIDAKAQSEATLEQAALRRPENWVAEHGDALYRYAMMCVGDRTAAEDLIQETLLAALKSRSTFQGRSEIRTWLVGILRHKIVDSLRNKERGGMQEGSGEADEVIDRFFTAGGVWARLPGNWTLNPAELAERREFWDVLRGCLEALPERVREAFALRMMSDVESQEVCKLMSITPTNLWVLLHRARGRLRACLEINWIGKASKRGG